MSTTVTALLFCYRLQSMTPTQFHDYIENKHVPLVKSLLGDDHPLTHTRYYTNKAAGFAVGVATQDDADLVAVVTYADKEAMQRSMALRMSDGIRERIQVDEDQFMDRSKLKLVMLGEGDVGR